VKFFDKKSCYNLLTYYFWDSVFLAVGILDFCFLTGEDLVVLDTGEGLVVLDTGEGLVVLDTGEGLVVLDTGEGLVVLDTGEGLVVLDTGEGLVVLDTGEGLVVLDTGEELLAVWVAFFAVDEIFLVVDWVFFCAFFNAFVIFSLFAGVATLLTHHKALWNRSLRLSIPDFPEVLIFVAIFWSDSLRSLGSLSHLAPMKAITGAKSSLGRRHKSFIESLKSLISVSFSVEETGAWVFHVFAFIFFSGLVFHVGATMA
jgi:hypothetical protein